MDGLLVIDKPAGPTSHDVVARVRRAIGERRVGHTGTLDPAATGVLPLVLGRATRLAQFMSGASKSYDAVVRLGFRTDTADAEGERVGPVYQGRLPSLEEIDRALDSFRGTFEQQPPAISAKKIGGQRSYKLARTARQLLSTGGGAPPRPRSDADASLEIHSLALAGAAPKLVTTSCLEVTGLDRDFVRLSLHCSSGFYVRALAQDLGERLGCGAHLASLRRTRSGDFTLADAVSLEAVQSNPDVAAERTIPLSRLLPDLGAVVLTPEGVRHAAHGRELGPSSWQPGAPLDCGAALVRLLDPAGDLVAIARPGSAPGLLHPFVVLM